MGKRDTKAAKEKREARRGKGAVKTANKTEKSAMKHDRRARNREEEEDLAALIDQYAARPKSDVRDEVVPPPTPRANASLTAHPRLEELLLFGGEIFDGKRATLFSDLFRYGIKRNEWRLVSSAPCPPPRASHQAVAVPSDPPTLFVFGGEYSSPTQTQFYHYKDLWALDLVSWTWTKVEAKNGPSARSGHRMVLLRDKLAVFGGFFDNLRDVKYYNDLYLFDLGLYKWSRVPVEPGASIPLPRSGCQFVAHPSVADQAIVFGGYFKKKAVQKQFNMNTAKGSSGGAGAAAASADAADDALEVGHEFKDMWVFDLGRNSWSTAKRSGRPPSQRSGFSMVADAPRGRLVCFGGVHDEEDPEHESLRSHFYADLHVYSTEHGKWFAPSTPQPGAGTEPTSAPLAASLGQPPAGAAGAARGVAAGVAGRGGSGAACMEVDSSLVPGGGAAGTSASAVSAAAARRAHAADEEDGELADGLADLLMLDTGGKKGRRERRREDGAAAEDGAASVAGASAALSSAGVASRHGASGADVGGELLPSSPCARMNAVSCVRANVFYLWGGLVESGAAEVTLDDLWALPLTKLDINQPDWVCLWRGTVRVEAEAGAESSDDDDDDSGPPEGEEGFSSSGSESGDDGGSGSGSNSDSEEWPETEGPGRLTSK